MTGKKNTMKDKVSLSWDEYQQLKQSIKNLRLEKLDLVKRLEEYRNLHQQPTPYMDQYEVCNYLKISPRTVRYYITKKILIPYTFSGGRILFRREDVEGKIHLKEKNSGKQQ